jgi:fatty-acyl-CoA synthase
MAPETLADLARINAARADPRLLFDDRAASYADLDEAARRVATGLCEHGLAAGDRLAIWLDNRWAWLVTLFACARLGAMAVVINTKFRSAEVGEILTRSGARHLLTALDGDETLGILGGCASLGALEVIIDAADGGALPAALRELKLASFGAMSAAPPLARQYGAADSSVILFTTSGTTSAPKFVMHDQRRVIRHGLDLATAAGVGAESNMFLAPPFCGTFGFSTTFAALSVGARLVVPRGWEPQAALRLLREHRVTHCMATDDAFNRLLSLSQDPDPFPDLRLGGVAGVNPRLDGIYAEAAARNLRFAGLYGSSELQAIVALQDPDLPVEERAKRGGRLVSPEARVRARDPESGAELPHGQAGELEFYVPGSGMKGYFGNAAATAAAYRQDGYFRSGDLGYTETDGRFVFLARMGDTLRLGGFLVDPTEIEQVLQSHPSIKEAQVVEVETERGNRPVAFVILNESAVFDPEDLKRHVAARLAKFKVPVQVHALDDFPRTVSANAAKVQKSKLKELARSRLPAMQDPR